MQGWKQRDDSLSTKRRKDASGGRFKQLAKRCLCAALTLCVLLCTSCTDAREPEPETVPTQTIGQTETTETTAVPTAAFVIPDGLPPVDVDLSALSRTMMYAQAYEMIYNPESYHGKSIRMRGPFQSFADETTGETRCVCIIQDATACCTQGIEFELKSGQDDLPPQDSEVLVSGTFDSYIRDMFLICVLRDAVLEAP